MTAIEFVIQIREDGEVIAMRLQRLQRRGRHIIFPGGLREKIARIKAEMIAHADQTPRRFFTSRRTNRQTVKGRQRQRKAGALQKTTAA